MFLRKFDASKSLITAFMTFYRIVRLLCLFILLQVNYKVVAQNRYCATYELHVYKYEHDAIYRKNYIAAQNELKNSASLNSIQSVADTVFTIPVVVHVLYNSNAENISDEQIKSQIDVLNEDYSGKNSSSMDIPDVWKTLLSDSKIRFKLALRDPQGNPTNGITRTKTSLTGFSIQSPFIYDSTQGGYNAWSNSSYLNIWVCTLENNALGFASFPGANTPETDGVVITGKAFGRKGTVKNPYNGGRTTTHEIGHWLNLRHIWGDDGGACSSGPNGGDGISDTPDQSDYHFRCAGFPDTDNCSPNAPGVMYMNYMDYTDDKCMMFFTPGQVAAIRNAFNGTFRSSLKNSMGCVEIPQTKSLALDSILTPVRFVAQRCFNPVLRFINSGTQTITNSRIRYSVNQGLYKEYILTDSILPGEMLDVTLPSISGNIGDNVLEARIYYSDSNTVNNYYSSGFRINNLTADNCEDQGIQIFPNPVYALSSVCVKTKFTETQQSVVSIFNSIGQLIFNKDLLINPGDVFSVPLNNLQAGIYYLRIDGDKYSKMEKFIFLPNDNNIVNSSICN